MKKAISNIAWDKEHDRVMYKFLQMVGYAGLEIAPTRIFQERPYEHLAEAKEFATMLLECFGLTIPSMQSIWFGMQESMFGTNRDRQVLTDYTKRAIDFAHVIGCDSLVFGCPKNRIIPDESYLPIAEQFFYNIATYAADQDACISLEANPPCYNTNFINSTVHAFDFCRQISSPGLMVNVDLGTCIFYEEPISLLSENIDLIKHIHISEPMLAPIQPRELHKQLKRLDYTNFCSIEMSNHNDLQSVQRSVCYLAEVL